MSPLDVDIADLRWATTHVLRIPSGRLYRAEPPPCMPRELMIRAIAYRMQERVHGGLAPATKRRLQGLVAEIEAKGTEALDPGLVVKTRCPAGARMGRADAYRRRTRKRLRLRR